MGCGASLDARYDDPMPVLVFGATGLVGGAVAMALLRDRRFQVKAVTRTPTANAARHLAEHGAIIVTADLNDPHSLERVMSGAHAVFLTTHYWEHMNTDKETRQGKNAVEAAVHAGVAHFVFCSSESPKEIIGRACGHMDAKASIEKAVVETNLPYTALRLPFLYENFLTVFRPHKVSPGVYAIALPMEDQLMDCMSVVDVAACVVNILLRPSAYLCRDLALTADKLSVRQITDVLNKHFSDRKFTCPKIQVKDYESFGFVGASDIAAMFEFYQTGLESRDIKTTRKIQKSLLSFERWVSKNKDKLGEAMKE
ncbi:nmrA-like family domain-containing protein 1 [Pomacea canaliculata]|uniref:nmrA-like family domain-containing protein 1 n=1 Tax=Pomacea canaliculata TaxID=400727 RepID=UPI000D733803|nr:nmrA-like family domain-containing protein 1 [Pomacea canaliculata]XP_025090114.1 nmrA-like family domain-containing protein 1 [Pomacea canaliculata]